MGQLTRCVVDNAGGGQRGLRATPTTMLLAALRERYGIAANWLGAYGFPARGRWPLRYAQGSLISRPAPDVQQGTARDGSPPDSGCPRR